MNAEPFRFHEDDLVWDHWLRHAQATPNADAIVCWTAGEEPYRWSWSELIRAASFLGQQLKELGIRPGDVCAIVVRHHRLFSPTYMAVSAVGALPAVLAYPNPRLHPDKFRQGLEGMSQHSGLDYVLTERELEPTVRPLSTKAGSTIREILFPLERFDAYTHGTGNFIEHAPCAPGDPVLLQHSSGTTGLQKPVVLSHRAILEHVKRYGHALRLDRTDRIVSWLPLYHDMGLIAAFYLPLTYGIPVIQLDPFEWVSAPVLLFEALSRERATMSWLPNFAYNLMADRIRDEDLTDLRLDSAHVFINCSEPVRADSHRRFFERFAPFGLRRETLTACYAMAETTYAVTQTPADQEARTVAVSREELAKGNVVVASAEDTPRVCVSSGFPIDGCVVRIVDENRRDLPPGCVGELAVSSVSLFDGYRNHPEKTAEVLAEGWYFSGDYGFLHEGECFVIGRKKDIIIVAGNNIYPEDVEDQIARVPGIIPGRVVAFGVENGKTGTEDLCVVAETEAATDLHKQLRLGVVKAGMDMDVTIHRIYLVPPRWLIKSSAGKPSRTANRERALAELTWK